MSSLLTLKQALELARIGRSAVLVLRHLESIADSDGIIAGPSARMDAIAYTIGRTTRSVQSGLAELEFAGLIEAQRTRGGGRTNSYRLLSHSA
jgi:hypothetical protein